MSGLIKRMMHPNIYSPCMAFNYQWYRVYTRKVAWGTISLLLLIIHSVGFYYYIGFSAQNSGHVQKLLSHTTWWIWKDHWAEGRVWSIVTGLVDKTWLSIQTSNLNCRQVKLANSGLIHEHLQVIDQVNEFFPSLMGVLKIVFVLAKNLLSQVKLLHLFPHQVFHWAESGTYGLMDAFQVLEIPFL